MEFKSLGVVGAGVIGVGVAQDLAQNGHAVVLVDRTEEILERARAEIRKNVRIQTLLTKGPKKKAAWDRAMQVLR